MVLVSAYGAKLVTWGHAVHIFTINDVVKIVKDTVCYRVLLGATRCYECRVLQGATGCICNKCYRALHATTSCHCYKVLEWPRRQARGVRVASVWLFWGLGAVCRRLRLRQVRAHASPRAGG